MNACEALLLGFYFAVALIVAAESWTTDEEHFGIVESLATGVFWIVYFGILLARHIVVIRTEMRRKVNL